MASLNSYHHKQNSTTIITLLIIILLLFHLLLSPISCFNQPKPSNIPPEDLLFVEKNRLGSIPPTCHNKCNHCHPCMAVQVPSMPGHEHVTDPNAASMEEKEKEEEKSFFLQGNNKYSNYKPLSWKCHCGGHFFNP